MNSRSDAILESARRIQLIAFDMCGSNRAALMQEVSALRDLAREESPAPRVIPPVTINVPMPPGAVRPAPEPKQRRYRGRRG